MEFDALTWQAHVQDREAWARGKRGVLGARYLHPHKDRFPSERISVLLAQLCSVNLDTGREHKVQTGTRKCGREKWMSFCLLWIAQKIMSLENGTEIFCSNPGKSMDYILPLILLGSIPWLKIWMLVDGSKSFQKWFFSWFVLPCAYPEVWQSCLNNVSDGNLFNGHLL